MTLFIGILFTMSITNAQILDPVDRSKDKATDKVNQKTDEAIDAGIDAIEDGIDSIFKKKDKKEKKKKQSENSSNPSGNGMENSNGGSSPSHSSNSKFDFVPGTQVLYADDFSHVEIGDFPAEFNTNASGEVVNVNGKNGKWLSMTKNGVFIPENIKDLPDNFTLEFEVGIIGDPSNNYSGMGINFTTEENQLFKDVLFDWSSSILYLHPGADLASIQILPSSSENEISNDIPMPQWSVEGKRFAKISIWRQKGRLRVYVNEDKIIDAPRFFAENKPYKMAFFRRLFNDCEILMTNIRYAVAGADTRTKLITEGKFVTNGILFDVNSDKIKPESNAVLKDIGMVLKENPTVHVKIIGHTDSDGTDDENLTLSKNRAISVKNALIKDFGIDASRMITDGKGEAEPIESNSTANGKSQNRRVEFIKQ